MLNSDILQYFDDFPLPVAGIAMFKNKDGNDFIAIEKCREYEPINIECNIGYIRFTGRIGLQKSVKIGCNTWLYKATERLALVVITDKYKLDSLCRNLLRRLTIDEVTLISIETNKDVILTEEKLKKNNFQMVKILFDYTYDYLPKCEDDELECC